MTTMLRTRRYGGELPAVCDPLDDIARPLPDNALCFSHGRAALTWLAEVREPFARALVSAYTCPTVPDHLRGLGLTVDLFDYQATDIVNMVDQTDGRVLVLIPAPFGAAPWVDAAALAETLGEKATVVVDAAQTAFGHLLFATPPNGAVLAAPRKALAVSDGAILALDRLSPAERDAVDRLPVAHEAIDLKRAARALFAADDPDREGEAVAVNRQAEAAWPSTACRMSAESMTAIQRIDPKRHAQTRRANAARLESQLDGALTRLPLAGGVPFNFPVLADDRDALLKRLHAHRLFATALWPDARHDRRRHPIAADLATRLLALPVDQRYEPADMDAIADIVNACL